MGGESKDAARHCGLGGGTLAKNWQKDVHPVPMAIRHLPVCSYLMLFDNLGTQRLISPGSLNFRKLSTLNTTQWHKQRHGHMKHSKAHKQKTNQPHLDHVFIFDILWKESHREGPWVPQDHWFNGEQWGCLLLLLLLFLFLLLLLLPMSFL